MPTSYGSGTIFQRGKIWYCAYWADGRQIQKSSGSTKRQDAVRLRDQLIGKKTRGELGNVSQDRLTCGELLDDLLDHADSNAKATTAKIYRLVVEANLRPFFGHRKATTVTTDLLKQYRRKRLAEGKSESTCNRELSLLRVAFHLGRKCTPPKVATIPYFPMVKEENARQGFLTDEQYVTLRDALPDELKPLFVTAYFTGVRLGELLAWEWEQVDFEQGFITLRSEATKDGHSRAVPILEGDMKRWLEWAHANAGECERVFHRYGEPIRNFRRTWQNACVTAGVSELKFHDLRRTAVRNMRRAGVSQTLPVVFTPDCGLPKDRYGYTATTMIEPTFANYILNGSSANFLRTETYNRAQVDIIRQSPLGQIIQNLPSGRPVKATASGLFVWAPVGGGYFFDNTKHFYPAMEGAVLQLFAESSLYFLVRFSAVSVER